jgi:hypothetical protein
VYFTSLCLSSLKLRIMHHWISQSLQRESQSFLKACYFSSKFSTVLCKETSAGLQQLLNSFEKSLGTPLENTIRSLPADRARVTRVDFRSVFASKFGMPAASRPNRKLQLWYGQSADQVGPHGCLAHKYFTRLYFTYSEHAGFLLTHTMSTNQTSHAMFPSNNPPRIRYYGHGSHGSVSTTKSDGVDLGGPPLLRNAILHDFLPLDLAPIDPAPSVHNLGLFSKLPDELLYLHILEELDLFSLIKFRNTSRHAHYVVDTMPNYENLVKWAPQVIRGVLAVQTNIVASVATIANKVRQKHCDRCDEAAPHIWLPTLERLCFLCAHRGPMPLKEEEMLKHYGLTREDLHLVPSFRFLPATFQGPRLTERRPLRGHPPTTKGAPYKIPDFYPQFKRPPPHRNSFRVPRQHILYDTQVAAQLALKRTGQEILPPTAIEDKEIQAIVDDRSKRQKCVDLPPSLVPRRCRRTMGLVYAPWLTSEGAESGVFCKECLYITGKDRYHAWRASGLGGCKRCESLRHQDWYYRRGAGYSLMLPVGSDVHYYYG